MEMNKIRNANNYLSCFSIIFQILLALHASFNISNMIRIEHCIFESIRYGASNDPIQNNILAKKN